MQDFRSLGNALYPEHSCNWIVSSQILDHWEMRSIRNGLRHSVREVRILDHWEMRSIRNYKGMWMTDIIILDHWEMRSIRNLFLLH